MEQTIKSWQSDILPNCMIKFRLNKKDGMVAVNGIEVRHNPTANEIVEICTLETKNKRFYN